MEMDQKQQRQTAYKAWIGDLLDADVSLTENRLNFVDLKNKKISRVNIVATVVDKFVSETKPYTALTLDDGTGKIRVKFFEDSEKIRSMKIGDTILVFGLLRFYNDEIYISPEIVRQVDARWLLLRKLELEQEYGKRIEKQQTQQSSREQDKGYGMEDEVSHDIEEEKISLSANSAANKEENDIKKTIVNIVAKNKEGIDVDTLIMSVNFPVTQINSAIAELIDEGMVYEPQPGKLRSM